MKKTLISFTLLLIALVSGAQDVPSRLQFGNMELRLSNSLRNEIEKQAAQLSRYPKYFNIKLTKAKLYFPIIERILREENVPDEFKYLVIQESALIPDAVSSSNAVGFWQFKIEAATEVGLRVDRQVDERMNIVSATRGAAKYLKSNNFYFDNWIYALLAYNTGRGGARRYVNEKHYGDRVMDLDKGTHWYVKTFLAHLIAVRENIDACPDPDFHLYEFDAGAGKTLKQIANEFKFSESELEEYNKWLKRGPIPMDKTYSVIIPMDGKRPNKHLVAVRPTRKNEQKIDHNFKEQDKFPLIGAQETPGISIVEINGKKGVVANAGDTPAILSRLGGVSISNFIDYNDISSNHQVVADQVYYFQNKRNKALAHYHVVMPGEDWWSISQKYAIKLKKLKQKNRVRPDEKVELKPGRVLWLRFIRPSQIPIAYEVVPEPQQPAPEERVLPVSQPIGKSVITDKPDQIESVQHPQPVLDEPEPKPKENLSSQQENIIEEEDIETVVLKKEPAKVKPEQQQEKPATHLVKPGETLFSIARLYQMSINDLKQINNYKDDKVIQPGELLFLVEQEPVTGVAKMDEKQQNEEKTYIYHQVASGETMYKIARQYNVTIKEIMEWNEKQDFNLRSGDNLKILRKENTD